ncbi:MAG: tRNA (cytidine(34)-2'-O)-methyltransferase [Pseudomonadota bacterium]
MEIVLYEPEIPPNTGNIMRLCANLGAGLHLVEPLGFELSDKRVRRAGLDYRDLANTQVHADWSACRTALAGRPLYGLSTRGTTPYSAVSFATDAVLVFGPETRGLPAAVRQEFDLGHLLRIPMRADSRSMNLSNAVAVVAYEVQRQLGFPGLR